jgi:hypothetical protein
LAYCAPASTSDVGPLITSSASTADSISSIDARCIGTQFVEQGSIRVVNKATFATVRFTLKKPVKLTTIVFSPTDEPIVKILGLGASAVPKTSWSIR